MVGVVKLDKWENTAGVNYNSILQVVNSTSGFVTQTINSSVPVALTRLSVTITPKFSNSKMLIMGVIPSSWSYVASIHLYKSTNYSTFDMIGNHGSNGQTGGSTALWTFYDQTIAGGTNSVKPLSVQYMDTPNTTNPITYQFYANAGWAAASPSTTALYINNRDTGDMLSSSYICVMEIAQ